MSHCESSCKNKIALEGKSFNLDPLVYLVPNEFTGPPESLAVMPTDTEVTVENNNPLQLQVQVQDKAGNLTVQPRLNVVCKVMTTSDIQKGSSPKVTGMAWEVVFTPCSVEKIGDK